MEGHLHALATLSLPLALLGLAYVRYGHEPVGQRLRRLLVALPLALVVLIAMPVRLCGEAPPSAQVLLPLLAWLVVAACVTSWRVLAVALLLAFAGGQALAAHYYALPARGPYLIHRSGQRSSCSAPGDGACPVAVWHTPLTGVYRAETTPGGCR